MKFRENYTYRKLDFIFPRAALDAMFKVDRDFIGRDIFFTTMMSGPFVRDGGVVLSDLCHRVMLIDDQHAEEYLKAQAEAVKPFETKDTYKGVRGFK